MRAFVVGFMIAGALAACSGDGPVSVAAQVELTQHEARWHQRGFHSYDFDLVKQQFGGTNNLHVSVRADSVDHVIDNDTGLPPAFPVGAMTVDDVFADANGAITHENLQVTLEFDEQYGYPTLLAINSNNPGGPFSAKLSHLVPVQ
jgi:hypothetical protein